MVASQPRVDQHHVQVEQNAARLLAADQVRDQGPALGRRGPALRPAAARRRPRGGGVDHDRRRTAFGGSRWTQASMGAAAGGLGVRPAAFGLGRRRAADGGQRAVSASGRGTRRAAATGGPSSRRRWLSGGHRWRRSRRTQLTRGASSLRGWAALRPSAHDLVPNAATSGWRPLPPRRPADRKTACARVGVRHGSWRGSVATGVAQPRRSSAEGVSFHRRIPRRRHAGCI